jgi:ubiquinone/menaquinone biosynthesis C-methylase UbiE
MNSWDFYWNTCQKSDYSASTNNKISEFLRDYWEQIFVSYPHKIKALDLACGKGFVGRIMLKHLTNCECLGIDKADIQGPLEMQNSNKSSTYRIVGKTALENLYIEPNSIDLVVSQFGAEYSQLNVTLRKVFNALKPSGKLHLVIHHASSELTHTSKLETAILSYLLNSVNLPALLQDMLQMFISGQVCTPKDLQNEMCALDNILNQAYLYAPTNPDLVNSYFIGVFALIEKYSAHGYTPSLHKSHEDLKYFNDNLRFHLENVQQQVSAAHTENEVQEQLQNLQKIGFANPKAKPILLQKQNLAWALTAEKT